MDSFASILCKRFAFIHWSSTFAVMSKSIQKTGLRRLSNSWSLSNYCLRWTWEIAGLLYEQIQVKIATTISRKDSVGATSDCKDLLKYDTVGNENAPICGRGIFTELHENCFERAELVINDGLDNLILSRYSFFINLLLVNCG